MPIIEYTTQIDRRLAGEPLAPYAWMQRAHLLADSAIGATSLVIESWPTEVVGGLIVIDANTLQCEVRRVASISGTTIGFTPALEYAHATNDPAMWHAGEINAMWFAATGDGATDDGPALVAAAAQLAQLGGGTLRIPSGNYLLGIDTSIAVASATIVTGDGPGATILTVTKDSDGDTFAVLDAQDVTIRDMTIIRTVLQTATPVHGNSGISIDGSSNVTIDNVLCSGMYYGFTIGNNTTGANENITLRGCRSIQPQAYTTTYQCSYGVVAYYCDGLSMFDCEFTGHWLDGIKINEYTKNVQIIGCRSNDNGVSYAYALNGNGIDTYAGNENILIVGGEYNNNGGAGIYAKCGTTAQGVGRGLRLVGVQCKDNRGSGFGCEIPGAAILIFQAEVIGGYFDENDASGIYLAARQVTVTGAICRKNGEHGITITQEAWGITLSGVQCIANSQANAGTYHGISMSGEDCQIIGAYINGADSDGLAAFGDDAALTKWHNKSINIGSTANNVHVLGGRYVNQANAADPVTVAAGGAGIVVNRTLGATPEGYSAYGPGSFVTDSVTGYGYLKSSAAGTFTGWKRVQPWLAPVAIKATNYTLTAADSVVVFTATATATLPAATGAGQTYRIICRAGTLTIDGASADTVKGEATQVLAAGEDFLITDTATGVWE